MTNLKESRATGKMVYARWTLFFFNFLFWGFGVAAIGVGIWIMVSNNDVSVITNSLFRSGTILVIVGGCIIAILGFLGWLGAYQEHIGILSAFLATMFTVCILEMAGGIWAGVNRPIIVSHLQDNLYNTIIAKYGQPNEVPVTRAFDNIQHNGCLSALLNSMTQHNTVITGIGVTIGVIQGCAL
ncbi:uncharacterized protein TRIADDRAFT_52149 [Trichoplax adhaerens]|uniref:Tetraspanin n=1 Tax=Trichoplax adhaerens TaxID=10228 RepID=B3RLW8_TRIAD|nr:hypothetical protein TRIADDRAFT_52149 [Trichoplax adhaerens]EDV28858.1 hypothetical protein TRIADDRAFT_52149 [Trichoplax adhaerens]|eukprot:XP_002108060.1 hypothetical protein TRIADDRAFT_52149 [Trichoplax adhaerens]